MLRWVTTSNRVALHISNRPRDGLPNGTRKTNSVLLLPLEDGPQSVFWRSDLAKVIIGDTLLRLPLIHT